MCGEFMVMVIDFVYCVVGENGDVLFFYFGVDVSLNIFVEFVKNVVVVIDYGDVGVEVCEYFGEF